MPIPKKIPQSVEENNGIRADVSFDSLPELQIEDLPDLETFEPDDNNPPSTNVITPESFEDIDENELDSMLGLSDVDDDTSNDDEDDDSFPNLPDIFDTDEDDSADDEAISFSPQDDAPAVISDDTSIPKLAETLLSDSSPDSDGSSDDDLSEEEMRDILARFGQKESQNDDDDSQDENDITIEEPDDSDDIFQWNTLDEDENESDDTSDNEDEDDNTDDDDDEGFQWIDNDDDEDEEAPDDDSQDEDEPEIEANDDSEDELPEDFMEPPKLQKRKKIEEKPEEEEPAEAFEDSDEDSQQNDKPSILDKVKNKFNLIKKQVLADMHGEEIPEDEDEDDIPSYAKPLEKDDENDEDSSSHEDQPSKDKKGIKKPNFKNPFKFVGTFYKKIVDIIFSVLTTILSILSKIPIIGRIFKPLLQMTRFLKKLAGMTPIILLLVIVILANFFMVPRSVSMTMPDNGSATFDSFSYDKKTSTASGVVSNTGEIIVDAYPEFEVWAWNPQLKNPKSWVLQQPVKTCKVDPISVDITNKSKVSSKCGEIKGFFPRVAGSIHD